MARAGSVLAAALAIAGALAGCRSPEPILDRAGDRSAKHVLSVFARDFDSWTRLRARVAAVVDDEPYEGALVIDRSAARASVDPPLADPRLDALLRTLLRAGRLERAYDPDAHAIYEKRDGVVFAVYLLGTQDLTILGQALLDPGGRKALNLAYSRPEPTGEDRYFPTLAEIRVPGAADDRTLTLLLTELALE